MILKYQDWNAVSKCIAHLFSDTDGARGDDDDVFAPLLEESDLRGDELGLSGQA
jgi:hypothetical protein